MNKVLLGLLLGALLGAIDGGSAWFTPAVRAQLAGIIFGSTIKGLIAGVAAGIFARALMHVPIETAREAREVARSLDADCAVAIGGDFADLEKMTGSLALGP